MPGLAMQCNASMVLTDMQALHLLDDTAMHNQYVTAEHGQRCPNSLQCKVSKVNINSADEAVAPVVVACKLLLTWIRHLTWCC